MSVIALIIVLGGTGYAAIALTTKKIARNAVTSAKVKRNSLNGADIRESTPAQVRNAPHAAVAESAIGAGRADTDNSAEGGGL